MNSNFWKLYNEIFIESSKESYSNIVKLQFLKTLIEKVSQFEELKTILKTILEDEERSSKVLSLIIKSIIAINYKDDKLNLTEQQVAVWLDFVSVIIPKLQKEHINQVYYILNIYATEANKNNQTDIFNKCGEIARKLFNWGKGLSDCSIKDLIFDNISRLIIDTYESNSAESKRIFEELKIVEKFNLRYLLYKKMDKVLEFDPDYVSEIYKYSIGFIERQDNELVITKPLYKPEFYSLRNFNKNYIDKMGLKAIETLLKCLNYSTLSERYSTKELTKNANIEKENIERISLDDNEIFYIEDASHIWGDSSYKHHNIYGIVSDVFNYISDINSPEEVDKIMKTFIQSAFCADLWRRLLVIISQNPTPYKKYLFAFLMDRIFQTSIDTRKAYGKLLVSSIEILDVAQRKELEEFIAQLPEDNDFIIKNYDKKVLEEKKNEVIVYLNNLKENLINLFPEEFVSLEESKKIKELNKQEYKNYLAYINKEDDFQVTSRAIEKYELYEMQGIKPTEKEKKIIDLIDLLDDFNNNWLNAAPLKDDIDKIVPILTDLYSRLTTEEILNQINSIVLNDAWRKIAETSSTICTASHTFKDDEVFKAEIKKTIRDCFTKIVSTPFDDENIQKDYLNYRTPANQAALALVHYCRFINDKELFEKLKEYAISSDSSIRNNIVEAMFRFDPFNNDFFEILNIILKKESKFEIKYIAYWNTLRIILNSEINVIKMLELIESTCSNDEKINLFARGFYEPVGLLINLVIYWNNEWSKKKLKLFFDNINYAKFYDDIVFSAFNNIRLNNLSSEKKDEILNRFYENIEHLFKVINDNSATLKERYIDCEKQEHVITETVSMFFLKILSIQEDGLAEGFNMDTIKRFDKTLEYILILLQDEEIFIEHPDNLIQYLKLTRITLGEANLIESINNIASLSKYISIAGVNQKNDYNYEQVLIEFVAFVEKINNQFIEKIKTDNEEALMNFINIINELSETDSIDAVKLIWDLK